MKSAGLSDYFEYFMSIDQIQKYKPHPDTYQQALTKAGVTSSEAMLITAHGWDITGALSARLQADLFNGQDKNFISLLLHRS